MVPLFIGTAEGTEKCNEEQAEHIKSSQGCSEQANYPKDFIVFEGAEEDGILGEKS